MSAEEIDRYLSGLEEPQRGTLKRLRASIVWVVPEAAQAISYRVSACVGWTARSSLVSPSSQPTSATFLKAALSSARSPPTSRGVDDQERAARPDRCTAAARVGRKAHLRPLLSGAAHEMTGPRWAGHERAP